MNSSEINQSQDKMNLISTEDLKKKFGSNLANDGISIDIFEGIWGLVGSNGAGKTTFLNMILKLLRPSSGKIKIFGKERGNNEMGYKNKIGFCYSNQMFPSHSNCFEFLEYIAKSYNIPKSISDNLISYLLQQLELDEFKFKNINTFSTGMKQKLSIAQSLIGLPDLALLDEPFANLDPHMKVYVSELVVEFHEKLHTNFVISSHNLQELSSFCTNYVFIEEGKVLWYGTQSSIPGNDLINFYMNITGKKRVK